MIYTDHLILRPCAEHDIDALHHLWTDSDVRRYLFDDVAISVSQAADIVRSGIELSVNTGLGFWAIHRHPSTPLVGFCGFRPTMNAQEIELLYGLLPQYWGQGLATEACLGALLYFWSTTSFHHVYASTDPPNQKSVAVMQRLGMRHLRTQQGVHGESLITYVLDRPRHFLS